MGWFLLECSNQDVMIWWSVTSLGWTWSRCCCSSSIKMQFVNINHLCKTAEKLQHELNKNWTNTLLISYYFGKKRTTKPYISLSLKTTVALRLWKRHLEARPRCEYWCEADDAIVWTSLQVHCGPRPSSAWTNTSLFSKQAITVTCTISCLLGDCCGLLIPLAFLLAFDS